MFKRFIISCNEATTICDKNQYGEATIFEKIKLSLHIFVCAYCKKYTEQNSLMTHFFNSYLENPCKGNHLEESEKAELEKTLLDEIKKSQKK
ncbi:hypothetical protein [Namhaeicola litoreus]|uniref:Glycine dehydrogenase n=1 Tax=Namhaeicola litoreus TaxID=1052145 RepID=A0ABW3XZN9_9FLAO